MSRLVTAAIASLLFVAVCSASSGSVRAQAPETAGSAEPAEAVPPAFAVPIEGSGGLAHFHAALTRLSRDASRRVRVLHYGDSNVAADLWTAVVRDALQRRFGDGGSGYLTPRQFGSWHRGAARIRASGGWAGRRLGFGRSFGPADGRWGLAGVAIEPLDAGATLTVDIPSLNVEQSFELHLLGRPRPSGAVWVTVDGGEREQIDTTRARPGLVLRRWRLGPGPHRVIVRPARGRPRVLGVSVEQPGGVVYDVLGINGHRASALTRWDPELWAEQLRDRRPDLVILSYGGNEALDENLSLQAYEARTREALERVRSLTPSASCLLVGPVASVERWARRMEAVAEIQRRLSRDAGCGFWDASRVTGGPGTLSRWVRYPGWVGHDRLHLGRAGYERVGREFVEALLSGLSL